MLSPEVMSTLLLQLLAQFSILAAGIGIVTALRPRGEKAARFAMN
jgi:hypothetical protein